MSVHNSKTHYVNVLTDLTKVAYHNLYSFRGMEKNFTRQTPPRYCNCRPHFGPLTKMTSRMTTTRMMTDRTNKGGTVGTGIRLLLVADSAVTVVGDLGDCFPSSRSHTVTSPLFYAYFQHQKQHS